jgi:outer membrane protein OmpA-like peptidoglycan-associated protein
MLARTRHAAVVLVAAVAFCVAFSVAGGAARAESGRLNFHANFSLSMAAPLSFGINGGGGLDWQFIPRLALDVNLGGGNSTLIGGQSDTNLFAVAAGLRIRLFDHHQGYADEPGGDLWGNFFIVPRAGYLMNITSGAGYGTVEVELGYEFAVGRPFQIGPFARASVAFGPDTFGYFLAGIDFSLELWRLPRRSLPPPPRRAPPPVETDDDDSGMPDSDEDGVADLDDACPGTRPHSKVDARGCVILAPQMVLEGITFAFDSAEIQPASEDALIRAAQSLRDNPTARVEIGGHTCDIGTAEYNQKLSEARATAVMVWLVAHGIDDARLTVRGYGDTQPKAPNDSDEHRALNRRIEFRRLDVAPPE